MGFDGIYYDEYMQHIFSTVIRSVAVVAKTSPLYQNLLVWAVWSNLDYQGKGAEEVVTIFEFSGKANNIFDRQYYSSYIGNENASCDTQITSYDKSRGVFSQSWDMNSTNREKPVYFEPYKKECGKIMNPNYYGYKPFYSKKFVLATDIISLSLAVALNLNLVPWNSITATTLSKNGLQSYVS